MVAPIGREVHGQGASMLWVFCVVFWPFCMGDSFQVELEPASLGSLNSTCRTRSALFPMTSCKSPRRALQGMVNGNNADNDPDPSIVM